MGIFLNEIEIEDAHLAFRNDPVLSVATEALTRYAQAINRCSDGWPYWDRGRRPAEKLMTLLSVAIVAKHERRQHNVSALAVQHAIAPMVEFAEATDRMEFAWPPDPPTQVGLRRADIPPRPWKCVDVTVSRERFMKPTVAWMLKDARQRNIAEVESQALGEFICKAVNKA